MKGKNKMEKDLVKFNDNIQNIGSKVVCKYEDDKGNYMILNIGSLLVSVSYELLDETQYKNALFEKRIDKNLKYNRVEDTRVVDKSTVTGSKKDQGTLVNKKIMVYEVWTATNGLRITKSFNNEEEAVQYAKDTNETYLDWLKVIDN